MNHGVAPGGTEEDSVLRESSTPVMRSQLANLVRGSSVTAHCHAATALPTRGYQRDHRRPSLTSASPVATPLDKSFHISRAPKHTDAVPARRIVGGRELALE
jgi:hypothetical protein